MTDTTDSLTQVNLAELQESPLNPRRGFDKASMDERTASIRERGILTPLLVRRVNSHFEIVAGARRFRAAKTAGLESVPVIVKEFTDEEAAEVMLIDNLQRQDVHPLDEAEGYRRLLKAKNGDVKAIAAKVGKSTSYIYGRLALNNLTEHSRKAYLGGRMELGHALLVAKLQPDEQKQVVNEEISRQGASIVDLKRFIEEELLLDLSGAPWKKDDETLIPKAGSCLICTKRTGMNPELFQDFGKGDKCLDGKCFHAKMDAFLVRKRLELQKVGEKVQNISLNFWTNIKGVLGRDHYRDWKGCEHRVIGLIVDGKGIGSTKKICLTSDCKKCNPGRHIDGHDFARQTGPERYKRRMEIRENKIQQEYRARLMKAVVPLIKGDLQRIHLLAIIREVSDNRASLEAAAQIIGKKVKDDLVFEIAELDKILHGISDQDLKRIAFAMMLQRDMVQDPFFSLQDDELLSPLVKLHGSGKIDMKVIEAQVRTDLETKKPKPPKDVPGKKPGKKRGKKAKPKAKGKTK
ncbi:MAG: ParB/RepB/Spo0J family partition protein [Bacteroidota bacterium]